MIKASVVSICTCCVCFLLVFIIVHVNLVINSNDEYIVTPVRSLGRGCGPWTDQYLHQESMRYASRQLSQDQISSARQEWRSFMDNNITLRYNDSKIGLEHESKGIVYASGGNTFRFLLTSIKILRRYGCTLPIEVWSFTGELNENQIRALSENNAVARACDDSSLMRPLYRSSSKDERHYEVKAAVIINSRFKHILYLDSDNYALRDPSYLFDSDEYKNTGAIFWPDFWKAHTESAMWKIFDIECENEWSQESGQILVNKERHWRALNLAWYINYKHDFYYPLCFGDAETFRFAFKALKEPYHMIKTWLAGVGIVNLNWWGAERFNRHTMLQADTTGRWIFVHANMVKFLLSNDIDVALKYNGNLWREIKRVKASYGDEIYDDYIIESFTDVVSPTFNKLFNETWFSI